MAVIRPFQAVRPAPRLASLVAALPYDVYNRAEAVAIVEKNPLSFLAIDRPETGFPASHDMYAPDVYQAADAMLSRRIADGTFVRDVDEACYVYALTMDGRTQNGIVACASIDDYLSGVIKKHENTRPEKELDRITHISVTSAQTGPIYLAYRRNDLLTALVMKTKTHEPLYDVTASDGIRHAIWKMSPDEARRVTELFSSVHEIYIADGHHRAASAVKVGLARRKEHPDYTGKEEFNYFLSVLFAEDELRIYDYNRVVSDLAGLTPEAFLARVRDAGFSVTSAPHAFHPTEKGTFALDLGGTWHRLVASPSICVPDPVKGLDVSLLQDHILSPILGIHDPKTDARIDFVGGIRGLAELERRVSNGAALAFAMYPTSMAELFAVADAGQLMPPKSTWFEPKLRSGFFIHEIER